jgi:predicted SnoaL-like aldol condensation-catalyzing enzyme
MTNSEMVYRWFDRLWAQGFEETIDEMMAPDIIVHGLAPEPMTGRAAFHEFYGNFRNSFPSVAVTIEETVEVGDTVAFRAVAKVSTADGKGPIEFQGSGFLRIANGHFVEGWNYWDFLSMMTQLGAVPADAMTMALSAAAART